jgi:hypothetical protein
MALCSAEALAFAGASTWSAVGASAYAGDEMTENKASFEAGCFQSGQAALRSGCRYDFSPADWLAGFSYPAFVQSLGLAAVGQHPAVSLASRLDADRTGEHDLLTGART